LDEKGVLWFQHRLVVPNNRELKNRIMDEAHLSKLSIHPGSSKMYQDLKSRFVKCTKVARRAVVLLLNHHQYSAYIGPIRPG